MESFGENFYRIRNDSIIPLVSYGVQRQKIDFWGFKYVISTKLIALSKISQSTYEITLTKSDFYRGLHCDIELFMNKSFLQYNDFQNSKNSSATWSFVTLYYFAFFTTTTLFRFLRKGFVFLQKEHTKNLELYALAVNSDVIKLTPGNYYFSYVGESAEGNIIIALTNQGEGLHKLSWTQLANTIREFIPFCDENEKTIFQYILDMFSFFSLEFPSTLRNKLNYQGSSSMLDLEKRLSHINLEFRTSNILKGLASIKSEKSFENQIKAISFLSSYLFKYCNGLYGEYNSRSSYGKDFNKLRKDFFKLKGINILEN